MIEQGITSASTQPEDEPVAPSLPLELQKYLVQLPSWIFLFNYFDVAMCSS